MKLITLIGLMLAASPAYATSTKLLSLDQLIQQSDKVVAADVTAREAVWKGRFIKTKIKLHVADCMKGDCAEREVEVESWGGEKDGITMRVDGATQYNVGEKVVVFLRPLQGGVMHTVGMAQGKFVPAFGAGQEGLLTRDEIGMNLVGALGAPPADGAADPDAGDDPASRTPTAGYDPLQGLTMGKLKGRIKELLALPQGPGGPQNVDGLGSDTTIRKDLLNNPAVNPGGVDTPPTE